MKSQPDYLIQFKDIIDLSIEELSIKIKSTKGIPVSNLTLHDLTYHKGQPLYSGNGVYIFKNKEEFVYVGKCSSHTFVCRIPMHFDVRPGAWMNSLLKRVVKRNFSDELDEKVAFQKALKEVMESCELILINLSDQELYLPAIGKDTRTVKQLENLVRIILEPYNKFKRKRVSDGIVMVKDYLAS